MKTINQINTYNDVEINEEIKNYKEQISNIIKVDFSAKKEISKNQINTKNEVCKILDFTEKKEEKEQGLILEEALGRELEKRTGRKINLAKLKESYKWIEISSNVVQDIKEEINMTNTLQVAEEYFRQNKAA